MHEALMNKILFNYRILKHISSSGTFEYSHYNETGRSPGVAPE